MNIGGLQKVSLIDYPDKISTVIFTNGCVFKCHYCYNPGLVLEPFQQHTKQEEVMDYLKKRKGIIDAVVITGGEPTLQTDLLEVIKEIKKLGYLIKLDSNGYLPFKLQPILNSGLVDYVAMDIKGHDQQKYSEVTWQLIDFSLIKQSVDLIMNSGIDYEFRTTINKFQHPPEVVEKIAKFISGAKKYYLQQFKPTEQKLVDPDFKATGYTEKEMNVLIKLCQPYVKECGVKF